MTWPFNGQRIDDAADVLGRNVVDDFDVAGVGY